MRNINVRLKREKLLAEKLGMNHVPFSGGTCLGLEDMQDDERLGQSKSTATKDRIPVKAVDLIQLRVHAGKRIACFVIDFERISLNDGTTFTDEIWVATPLSSHLEMYQAWFMLKARKEFA